MQLKKIMSATLAISALSPGINAADNEGSRTDLRIEAILLDKKVDSDSTATSGLGSVGLSSSDDYDNAYRIGLTGVSHFKGFGSGLLGMVGGGSLYYSELDFDHASISERYRTLSAQVRLGLGVYLGDIFHVEATPFAGIGASRGEIDSSDSDIGLYWEYGISAGAFANLGKSFQVGLIAGWLHSEYDLDFDENANFPVAVSNVNVQLTNEGFFIGASIGSRM